ncbi:hypothetical protein ASD24_26825 [Paenibacillus sp. Root52]|uniref:hypothetical protein n=1 Tax=Paenibacillus sp. Root52 TaxID=1736552 RepID=UPI0006FD6606|nr:hypothetical protein [Paenibacillus sp. Root52]KQY87092.1 hypothetical protein ASD24_26825 [Paenibacillus sp. Root52]
MRYDEEYVELRLKEMVLESISQRGGYKHDKAEELVEGSTFIEMLKEDPDFIGHYPPEYWADYILEEHLSMGK